MVVGVGGRPVMLCLHVPPVSSCSVLRGGWDWVSGGLQGGGCATVRQWLYLRHIPAGAACACELFVCCLVVLCCAPPACVAAFCCVCMQA